MDHHKQQDSEIKRASSQPHEKASQHVSMLVDLSYSPPPLLISSPPSPGTSFMYIKLPSRLPSSIRENRIEWRIEIPKELFTLYFGPQSYINLRLKTSFGVLLQPVSSEDDRLIVSFFGSQYEVGKIYTWVRTFQKDFTSSMEFLDNWELETKSASAHDLTLAVPLSSSGTDDKKSSVFVSSRRVDEVAEPSSSKPSSSYTASSSSSSTIVVASSKVDTMQYRNIVSPLAPRPATPATAPTQSEQVPRLLTNGIVAPVDRSSPCVYEKDCGFGVWEWNFDIPAEGAPMLLSDDKPAIMRKQYNLVYHVMTENKPKRGMLGVRLRATKKNLCVAYAEIIGTLQQNGLHLNQETKHWDYIPPTSQKTALKDDKDVFLTTKIPTERMFYILQGSERLINDIERTTGSSVTIIEKGKVAFFIGKGDAAHAAKRQLENFMLLNK